MASNKKTKKKGVTLSFQEFSARVDGDNTTSGNVIYAPPKKNQMSSWADEVEEDEMITAKERIVLPTAPRAARGPAYDDAQIPRAPPFQANIGNLHYEIEEDDIYKFFRDLEILEIKLPRDQVTGRIKGFGFIVFESRKDLIDALVMNEQMLRGRPVRVALLEGGRGGENRGREGRGGRPPAEDEGVDNWRSVAKGSSGGGGQGFGGGGGGGFDRPPRTNFPRNDFPEDDEWRRPNLDDNRRDDRRDDRQDNRHHSNFDFDRREMRSDRDRSDRGPDRFDRSDRGGSDPDFVRPLVVPRPEREQPREPREPPRERQEPSQRKKLILAPRTVDKTANSSAPRAASIFGEATPVDTLKREMEIEEKIKNVQVEKVVRLLSRDGSEKKVAIETKWRNELEEKDSHSDPEDDRDVKLAQQRFYQEDRGKRRVNKAPAATNQAPREAPAPARRFEAKKIGKKIDADGFLEPSTTRPVSFPVTTETELAPVINKFAALHSDED